jgi:hypothetical protein
MSQQDSLCVDAGVDPLLTELREPVAVFCADDAHPAQADLREFVRTVFRSAHGAHVDVLYPCLLGYTAARGLRAVVGYRGGALDGNRQDLFAEQYLDAPAEKLIEAKIGRSVPRCGLVEVGNLALRDPGHARWVIAATTLFLAGAGYRWVLFTATRPLANAFRRLGLKPIELAQADPARLPDGGAVWGRYYLQGPAVYAGDILAGAAKLRGAARFGQPYLRRMLDEARRLGTANAAACAGAGRLKRATP